MARKAAGKARGEGMAAMYSGRAAADVTPLEMLDGDAAPARRGPKKKGLVKAMFSLEPGQLEALRREASRRAEQDPDVKAGRKSLRAAVDASALVRDAIDAWLAKIAKS